MSFKIRDDMLHRLTIRTLTGAFLCAGLLACDNEPPPRTVTEFMENPILLEAAVVRCAQNRAESRYDAECMNAREAVKIIEAREEASRRAGLEAESERKRQALRRTQQAAAEARRRAEEERRRREEAEYAAQFGEPPPESAATDMADSNAPMAVLPAPPPANTGQSIESPYDEAPVDEGSYDAPPPVSPPASTSAPVAEAQPQQAEPETAPDTTDLDAIREELKRRSDQDGS